MEINTDTDIVKVTPPDFYIPVQGVKICTLGGSEEWQETAIAASSDIVPNREVVFYCANGHVTTDTLDWLMMNWKMSDIKIVNIGDLTDLELAMAGFGRAINTYYYYDEGSLSVDMMKAISNMADTFLFHNWDNFAALLLTHSQTQND